MAAPNQPSGAVQIRDLGIGKLRAELAKFRDHAITIGHQGDSGAATHPNADASVGQVAAWMEFGTPGSDDRQYDVARKHIPSRPFVRMTFARHQVEFAKIVRDELSNIVDGRATAEEAQERIGERMLERLRETILEARGWAVPLAQATIDAKGHDDPLIDSGTLYDKASYAVRDGETIVRQGGEQ
jgi:hypothetical protein